MNTLFFSKTAKLLGLCCFFFVCTPVLFAQTEWRYSGTVLDHTTREPVIGVPVCASKGVAVCTSTNSNGQFSLLVSSAQDSLRITGMGYDGVVEATPEGGIMQLTYLLRQNAFEMTSAQVVGFLNEVNNLRVPATIGTVKQSVLLSADGASLQAGLNTIPGVVMDTRGQGGSQRLNIRGSFLRSPFAVRNVKTYLNGIPFSSPDGSTPLELIDASDIHRVEVIKGPAGSIWGSGTGGVLHLTSVNPLRHGFFARTSHQIGAFGLYRSANEAGFVNGYWSIRASHVHQENTGYREQEWNKKQQLSVFANWRPSKKRSYFFYLASYKGRWALPGGLNELEVAQNPRQARPFSVENNASLERERYMAAASQEWRFSNRLKNTSSIYLQTTDKVNPYGTSPFSQGYKVEAADGAGGRTDFSFNWLKSEKVKLQSHLGGEYHWEYFTITESDNVGGQAGDFLYNYNVHYHGLMGFASLDASIGSRWLVSLSNSWNQTIHQAEGRNATNFEFDTRASWPGEWLPRAAASFRWFDTHVMHASVSYGNSQPTVFEQIDYENERFNLDLLPEHGVNYEGGLKGAEKATGIQYEVSAYQFILNDAILAGEVTTSDGDTVTAYSNTGRTQQEGIEWSLRKQFQFGDSVSHVLQIWAAGAFQRYRFVDYPTGNENAAGNLLPGVPQATVNSGVELSLFDEGLRFNATHYWVDRVPLNNANTDWGKGYHLINTRLTFQSGFSRLPFLNLELFAGVQNMLNTSYTSFFALNAPNGRYFNPSLPRNMFWGFSLRCALP
jgi:iron complex outermembrane recepter protein